MRRLQILPVSVAALLLFLALFAASASAAAPVVLKTTISDVTTSSVTLEGEVDPEERVTEYRFEYGLADCFANPCTSVPVPDGVIPKGDAPVLVEQAVEGLEPGTTYHFRLVAKNAEGEDESPDRTFTTFGLPLPPEACPNDSLRTNLNPMAKFIEYLSVNLPDCRAYEQASPVDKNGVDVKGLPMWVKAAADGSAATFMTTTGIPGGDGAQELPPSLSRHGANDWSTSGMLPPQSYGPEAFVRGWTPDFSYVYSSATKLVPARASAFLARSAEGEITEIVPHTTAMPVFPEFAAASADGAVVVFETPAKLLPEAIAGASNVYAWERSSEELRLAAALNDGSAPTGGAFAGPYDWGSEGTSPSAVAKGGSAASYYLQDQHALSADGSRLYFTAAGKGKGELYLRLNPTEAQSPVDSEGKCTDPAKACTIQVSATQKTNGKGGGPDPAGPRPAAFMGASADGSVAFLASSEKLTNDAYTGPEPEAPAIAQAPKDDGDPKNLTFEPAKAAGIALNATHIYWANPEDDTIERAPLDGTGSAEVFVDVPEIETEPGVFAEANPQYVALSPTHVYWSATGPLKEEKPQDGKGLIGRAKIGASGAEEIDADFITGANNPQGVAVNSEHVYWANGGRLTGNNPQAAGTRTIGRAELSATAAKDVKQDCIQVDEIGVGQDYKPQGITINATHIYAAINATQDQSYLFRYDLGCSAANRKLFFDSQHLGLAGLRGVAIDSEFLYWARQGQNTIGRIKLSDFDLEPAARTPEREWIKDAGFPFGLAVNAANVFWSANQGAPPNAGNDLYRYEVATGDLTDLSVDTASVTKGADVQGVLGTSQDGSSVYFVANGVLGAGASAGNCEGAFSATTQSINYTGECNLYLAREGEATRFIARLDAGGGSGASDATNWLPHGTAAVAVAKTARVSADGETVLFRSQAQLTGYDNEGTPMLYRWAVGDTAPSCVSCNPTGAPSTGEASLGSIGLSFLTPNTPAFVLSRNLSADGTRVFFETPDALVAGDTNGLAGCPTVGPINYTFRRCQDVYEWEAQGTGSCKEDVQGGGCLYLLSDGGHDEASFFGDASSDGDEAFLITSSRLVGQDQDQLYDLYTASVDGGLASQNQPPPPSCLGEACRPAPPAPPASETPGSSTFSGPGNVKEAATKPCPKGKRKARVKGKVRCVAKRKGKGKARRRAGHQRRAAR